MKTGACLTYFFHDCRPGPLCQLLLVLKVYWCIAYIVCNKGKGQISKRVFQENKAGHIFGKTSISYPLIRIRRCAYQCAYQGIRKIRLSEKLTCFVFLKHPFLDSSFCLITDDSRVSSLFLIFRFFSLRLIYQRTLEFRVDYFLSSKKINIWNKWKKSFADRPTHCFFWHITDVEECIFWP